MNKVVSSKLSRRTALSLAAAALFGGTASMAGAASIWTERAASGERVSLEAIRRGETYTRFIVHYIDASLYGTREDAAVADMAAKRAEADLSRVSRALSTPLALVRPSATGGFVFDVRSDGARRAASTETVMRELARNPDLALVEPDLRMRIALTPNDTRYQDQWHYFQSTTGMNLPEAWDISTSSGVFVAVIDTGITTHSDLSGQTVAGYDFISDTTVSNDGNGRDSNPADPGDAYNGNNSSWHGTHVAGTISRADQQQQGRGRRRVQREDPAAARARQVRRQPRRHFRRDPLGLGRQRLGRAREPDPGQGHQPEPRRQRLVQQHLPERDQRRAPTWWSSRRAIPTPTCRASSRPTAAASSPSRRATAKAIVPRIRTTAPAST